MEPTTSAPITPNAAQSAANDAPPSLLDESFFTWMGRQITLQSDQITKQSFDALHFLTTFTTTPSTALSSSINAKASPWSPITLAPTDNSSQIFSHLDPTTLRSFARVSKTWQKEITKAVSMLEKALYQELRDKGVIFGPEDWRTYFGDPGVVPPLEQKTFKILKGPCPFWPGKRVEETHILLFLPATNNGAPITFNTLGALARAPQGGGTATGYDYVWNQISIDHGNAPTGPARWLLITRQIVPGSAGMPFNDQVTLLNAHPGYRVAKLGEAVALAFARRVSSGELLLSETFTCCEEKSAGFQLIVGGFALSGLLANYYNFDNCARNGVVGVLPCGSSQANLLWSLGAWMRSLLP